LSSELQRAISRVLAINFGLLTRQNFLKGFGANFACIVIGCAFRFPQLFLFDIEAAGIRNLQIQAQAIAPGRLFSIFGLTEAVRSQVQL
jgi:hypothetical protein